MKLCDCGCGKEVIWSGGKFLRGHGKRNKEVQEKFKQTCLDRYGSLHPSQSKEVKEKFKQTCLDKYGVESSSQVKEIKEKHKQTCLDKYGVENPSQLKKIKEKKTQTSLINYGTEYPNQSNEIKEKTKQTCLKNYGVEYSLQSEEVKEKKKHTCLKKYGVEYALQSNTVKKKSKQTCLKHYGVENYSQTIEMKNINRISAIKRTEIQKLNGEPLMPCIGPIERNCLNELEIAINKNIVRNDPSFKYVIGRFPDGHIPELKLFIQFDERDHFEDNEMTIYKQDDIDCTLQLASLGYIVYRISEKQWKNNKDQVINQFKELVSSGDKNE